MHSTAAGVRRLAAAVAQPAAATCQLRSRGSALSAARQLRHTSAVPITAIATPVRSPLHKRGSDVQSEGGDAAWAPPQLPPSTLLASTAGALHRGMSDLWQAYLHSLQRHPLLTKAATSFFCVCVGDGIAQWLGGAPFSAPRVLRLAAYSSTVGAATGHYWHRWLEAHVYPEAATGNRSVLAKMALDQLVLTPVMTAGERRAARLTDRRCGCSRLWMSMRPNVTAWGRFPALCKLSCRHLCRNPSDCGSPAPSLLRVPSCPTCRLQFSLRRSSLWRAAQTPSSPSCRQGAPRLAGGAVCSCAAPPAHAAFYPLLHQGVRRARQGIPAQLLPCTAAGEVRADAAGGVRRLGALELRQVGMG
jgi:hypothetical protein